MLGLTTLGAIHTAISLVAVATCFCALAVGTAAALTGLFGRWSHHVQAISYSVTLLFHMIPGFTESLTRLPPSKPVLPNAEAPEFGMIYAALLLLFIAGLVLQLRWLRRQGAVQP